MDRHRSRRTVRLRLPHRSGSNHLLGLRASLKIRLIDFDDFRIASGPGIRSIDNMAKPTPSAIKASLRKVPKWRRKGSVISRTYEFKDFVVAMKFVNRSARLAEKAWHHPDINIRWNRVTLSLTTHDEGGLTEKDFALAMSFDRVAG